MAKMKIHRRIGLLIGLVVCCLAVSPRATMGQTKSGAQADYEHLIYSVKGADLYRAHCGACHGFDGKGGGSVAQALKVKPADLTILSKSSGGKFPTEQVRKIISG